MVEVGIYGASGYMGGEALRILLEHPQARVAWATSRSGRAAEHFHRNLYGMGVRFVKPQKAGPCDAVLLALPGGQAMELAPRWLAAGTKVIDLGADFRLKSRPDYERVYGRPHTAWELAEEAVYGIPELHRDRIRRARLVANPGCYATAAILALAPLVKARLIDRRRIVVDGLSGTAGAGAEPDVTCYHPEIANNLVLYNVVDHRHTYEMEQELALVGRARVAVHFTTTYVPITRGILTVCHCFPRRKARRDELLDLYRKFYKGERFVKVFDMPPEPEASWNYRPYPWVAATSGTNYCHIGLDVDARRGRVVVFSVLDSLGKGGAHAAVQNLNLMFGLDEASGLGRAGLHPY
jgi:N-acetyl-gamma-glutamyl-phosphate reductase common form